MSYYFTLPRFNDLNDNQKLALGEIDAISLSGGPGTGKTVVSLLRHINNYKKNPPVKSLLLTYTKTLEHYLINTANSRNNNAGKNIDRTQRWIFSKAKTNFEEIIIDEAQDVPIDYYETINKYAGRVSFGADDAQSLYQGTCNTSELNKLFSENEDYELEKNYRNSREILEFTISVFPNIYISRNALNSAGMTGRKPFCIELGWDNFDDSVVNNIIDISQEFNDASHNIGVLVAGDKQVDKYFDILTKRIKCSKYHSKMPGFNTLERLHITTFKSSKGLEFDTVIIPSFDSYSWFIKESDNFSENDFYVAITRAKLNLYLLCKNDLKISANTYITL
ncbi:UvrD-like helicase C-terminal domain-containing protein [Algibacter lectus]|uniref:3'-5' exonuclease n=1 Tax=Algibacter lectus TaxID=221126 RepID=UPI0008E67538|nr:3'-5' exonuclease [Algibacter lectus]SFD20948.1 UvrD-like helicase C-terminal domain-containing protein [Algibacter lectus]